MSDYNALFFMWLRDKKAKNRIRGELIDRLKRSHDPLTLLGDLCADLSEPLKKDELIAAKRIRFDFNRFLLKPRSQKYMSQRFYLKHMIHYEEAYRRFAAKMESSNPVKPLDLVAVYATLLGVSPT